MKVYADKANDFGHFGTDSSSLFLGILEGRTVTGSNYYTGVCN